MKRLIVLLAPLALWGCQASAERGPEVWYETAEVLCRASTCPRCRGAGDVACNLCAGKGKVHCTSCKDGKERCPTCKGDGSKDGKKCKSCDGEGRRACFMCGGTRMMKCRHCGGLARLHCLSKLQITDEQPAGDDAWPRGMGKQK